MRPSQIKIEP
jgi:hypothetical protein